MVSISMAERHTPKDILINILVRLPALSLQKFKHVSREWIQIISDPNFAEAHLAHQSQEEFGCGIIIATEKTVLFVEGSSSSNLNQPLNMKLPGAHGDIQVHDSCKGLVLFQCTSRLWQILSLHVANPITGDKLRLPRFNGCRGSLVSASIVCSSSNSREIKVVVVGRPWEDAPTVPTAPLKCGVLTLSCPSWREVHIPGPAILFEPYAAPVFAKGSLHWKYASGILSLDLGREKFHETDVTFCSSTTLKYYSSLCELDGCLAIVRPGRQQSNQFFKVWILRDSGWTWYSHMDTAFFRHVWPSDIFSTLSYMDDDRPYFGITIKNGKVILFWHVGAQILHLLAYDVGDQVMTKFTRFSRAYFLPYRLQGKGTIKAHISSMVLCSLHSTLEKRIKVCGEGRIMPASVSNFVSKCLRHFACSINNMIQSRPN